MIGQHEVPLALHPEIETSIKVIVARNADEAARIERGENATQLREPTEAEAAVAAAEEFFEPEALRARDSEQPADAEEAAAPAEKS
jgi:large subunit ribosomal protein L9